MFFVHYTVDCEERRFVVFHLWLDLIYVGECAVQLYFQHIKTDLFNTIHWTRYVDEIICKFDLNE